MSEEIKELEEEGLDIEIEDEQVGVGDKDDDNSNNTTDSDTTRDKRLTNAEKRRARLEKQREARQRKEDMLRDYEYKIQALEQQVQEANKRYSNVESKISEYEKLQIDKTVQEKQQELDYYRERHATAVTENDGNTASQAVLLIQKTERELADLIKSKNNKPQQQQYDDPRLAIWKAKNDELAHKWASENSDWFNDPTFKKERDITMSYNNRLLQEGVFNPATPEFYEELNYRLKNDKRMTHIFGDDVDINEPQHERHSYKPTTTNRSTNNSSATVTKSKITLHPTRDRHIIDAWRTIGILDDKGKLVKGKEAKARQYWEDIQNLRKK